MDEETKKKLDIFHSIKNNKIKTISCKICGTESPAFDVVDFRKCGYETDFNRFGFSGIPVYYHRCPNCEFIFTDFFDTWSNEEFSKYVYNDEYGLIDIHYQSKRPLSNATMICEAFGSCRQALYLDYGGGNGLFRDTLRDSKFEHVDMYDPISNPILPNQKYDVIFAFECLEHTPLPIQTFTSIDRMLKDDGILVFTQSFQPKDILSLGGNWHNIGPKHGHISTYSLRTIEHIRALFQYNYVDIVPWLHAFCKGTPSQDLMSALSNLGATTSIELDTLNLCAPGHEHVSWHDVEQANGQSFQWTKVQNLSWDDIHFKSPRTRIVIPILMNNFSNDEKTAEIFVDGKCLETEINDSEISALFTKESKSILSCVELRCPKLMSPHQISGADDDRLLGLAIPVHPPTPKQPSQEAHLPPRLSQRLKSKIRRTLFPQ